MAKWELGIESFSGEHLIEPVVADDRDQAITIASMRLIMTPTYRRVDTIEDGMVVATARRDIERPTAAGSGVQGP